MPQAAISNLIDPPPRLTGSQERDTVSLIQWVWSFYTKAILSGGLLQPQNLDPALISLGDLVATPDTMAYFTAEDTFDLTGLTAFARSILDDADAATVRATIGAGTLTAVGATAPIASSGGDSPVISILDFAASGAAHARGAVPDPGAVAGAIKYLREDATWATPPGAGDVVGPAGATANDFAQFDGATGKLIKGGLALSISTTLVENSDVVIASQKAVKAYADALIAANDAMVYKGATDCSGNPNYPAANAGDTYRVSVAGKIGGAAGKVVEAGDFFICNADGTAAGAEGAVGTYWNAIQSNLDGAVIGPSSSVDGDIALFNGATGKLLKTGAAKLKAIEALASAVGWLHNDGAGAFAYSTPTASDVGAQPADADLTTWAGITPGANIGTFLATPSSANLAAALTDETGSSKAVFSTRPAFDYTIGVGGAAAAAAGAGITFPAVQSSASDVNTLDDYEEGTFSPSLLFNGSAAGITYSAQAGYYTKIGRFVHVSGYIILTNKGAGSNYASINDLPFAGSNDYAVPALRLDTITYTGTPTGYGPGGTYQIYLEQTTEAGAISYIVQANFANTSAIMFAHNYNAAT